MLEQVYRLVLNKEYSMKRLFILPVLFFAFNAEAFLTPSQSENVLQVIDQACGDSWCEGAYDIQFDSLRCSRHQRVCQVKMTFVDSEDRTASTQVCLIEQVHHAEDLIQDIGRPSEKLTKETREALGACVTAFYSQTVKN